MSGKRYALTILGFLTALLSACSQYSDPYKDVPKEVDGHPVYEVPFEQPLVIDPKKEQVFYFKLKKKYLPKNQAHNYTIYIMAMYPYKNKKYYDIEKGVDMNNYLIENRMLKCETKLAHFDKNGKKTQIGLSDSHIYRSDLFDTPLEAVNVPRFQSNQTQFIADTAISSPPPRVFDGEEYSIHENSMAYFLIQEKGGYYRLSIRASRQYPDYPKLKLAVYVSFPPSGK